jgi:hypothetical protein
MSKYEPLADFLHSRSQPVWEADFSAIERVLGFPLPKSARQYHAWWANQSGEGHSQTVGWRSAGWKTSQLDLNMHRVTFERESAALPCAVPQAHGERDVMAGFALHGAIEFLNGLGGSMPDFVPAPRDRVE